MANNVVHFEINVDDVDRAQKFYKDVFGWAFSNLGEQFNNYSIVYPDGEVKQGEPSSGINGGMMKREVPLDGNGKAVNAFVCVVAVENVDEIVEKAKVAGGSVEVEPEDAEGVGRIAYIRDTENNQVGIIKPIEGGM